MKGYTQKIKEGYIPSKRNKTGRKNIIMNLITKTQYPQRLHVGKHY